MSISQETTMNLTEKELKDSQNVVKQALDILGKKNLSFIIHGVSFPSLVSEDTGTGTLNSKGGREFIDFIKNLGFNSIQLGPEGKTKSCDASPYIGTVFSTNPLFIDLAELTASEWDEILREETFKKIVENNPKKDQNRLAYSYIYSKQNEALLEAYNTFKTKLNKKSKKSIEIDKKFTAFKKNNSSWLDKDALYEGLSIKHNNDYWPIWQDDLDKGLFGKYKGSKEAKERITEIEKTYKDDMDFYKFCQFLINEQKEKTKEYTLKNGIKTISDIQVAFSDRDYWANQTLFVPGYCLGSPPDYFTEDGQAWGVPVLDCEKLYNTDGSLSETGKVLYERFSKVFKENPGGTRIDHAMGLFDPWVYISGKKAKSEDGAARLYSSPDCEELKSYSRIEMKDLNTYRDINCFDVAPDDLDKILPRDHEDRIKKSSFDNLEIFKKYSVFVDFILKVAKDCGLDKDAIIFEDLGTITTPVTTIMGKYELSGIRVTQFVNADNPDHMYRGRNIAKRHWVAIGTHDNMPFAVFIGDWYKNSSILEAHIRNLTEDLVPDGGDRNAFAEKLRNNPQDLVKAKFMELFTNPSENIQIFFTDVFGINEPYNVPGTSGDANWSLRVPNNFKDTYFNNLAKNNGLNLPEILKMSIEAKGSDFVKNVTAKHPELLAKLEIYAKKFKSIK